MQAGARAARQDDASIDHGWILSPSIICRARSGPAAARIVLLEPLAIITRAHALHPLGALNVPAHRLVQARLEGLLRGPAQLALDLARIDRVTQVVPGPILHVGDEAEDLRLGHARLACDGLTQALHHIDVLDLVVSADVVRLAVVAGLDHAPDGLAVVGDVEPVADVFALAVDGQRLALEA